MRGCSWSCNKAAYHRLSLTTHMLRGKKALNYITQSTLKQYCIDESTARASAEQAGNALLPTYDLEQLRSMLL